MATAAPPVLEHHGMPITVSILGTVIDDFGLGVAGATVVVRYGSQPIASKTSGEHGQFDFPHLPVKVGFHSIHAQMPSFTPAEEQLVLTYEMDKSSMSLALRLQAHDQVLSTPSLFEEEFFGDTQVTDAGPEDLLAPLPPLSQPLEKANYVVVPVFFATDRNRRHQSDPRGGFGNDRSQDGSISFGVCDVSIPNIHRIGKIERPSVFKLQFRENPEEHIVLMSVEIMEVEQFYKVLSAQVGGSPNRDVFMFIHGYMVTFPEAIRRTAQIAFDLNFQGVPVCYSWASQGSYSGYPADEATVEWSTPHLVEVLRRAGQLPGVETIHLIAHSMGSRALIRCLQEIAKEFSGRSPALLNQVIMAAPDIDAGVFTQIAGSIIPAAKRTTLYASSNDAPLVMSRQFHNYPRAGEVGEGILILPGLDTIDASAVPADILGHSYYGNSRTVLSDIYELLKHGSPPPRFGVHEASHDAKPYWIFVP